MKTAIFIYQVSQIEILPTLLSNMEGEYEIVAGGADIEFELEKKEISFLSAQSLLTVDPYERLLTARQLSKKIMDDDTMSFFSHGGISLSSLYTPTLFYHLTYLLYYFDMFVGMSKRGYNKIIFPKEHFIDSPAAGVLAALNSRAVYTVAHLISQKGIIVEAYEPVRLAHARNSPLSFILKRAGFDLFLFFLNTLTAVTAKKKIRILASEYWRNIAPLMKEMPDAELVLLDRAEVFKIGLGTVIRNRMRFIHTEEFANASIRREARVRASVFRDVWNLKKTSHSTLRDSVFGEYSLAPILEAAVERFITDSERLVITIEGTKRMLQKIKPDIVGVRASISAQTHFAVLCEVARQQSIPSVEFQHGIFSVGPESETRERTAEYIAEYGAHERKLWEEHDYATRSKFVDVGSPRFDTFISESIHRAPKEDGKFRILHIGPPWFPGSWNDSWDVYGYFKNMAEAVRDIPNVHVTIKLRGDAGQDFYYKVIHKTFGDIPYAVEISKPLFELLVEADLVVSCHSTAILEALLAHKPMILDASLPVYRHLAQNDFQAYLKAGAFVLADTPENLKKEMMRLSTDRGEREALSRRAEHFIQEKFLFKDGKSKERLAHFIRSLVKS